jgi:SAM-dependent methyltransferase
MVSLPRRLHQGRCNLCGHRTLFAVMGSERVLDRSDALCVRCRSRARTRHVAHCAVEAFAGRGITAVSEFQNRPEFAVLNTSSGTPMAEALGDAPNIHLSEFFDGVDPGATVDGVRCEDLTRLTFGDASLDLVITEDVLEHVPEREAAQAELARVLKPGGVHVCTVPFSFAPTTTDLFDVVDGERVLREPIEYHGDLVRGRVATFYHFGWDLTDLMDDAGFDTRVVVANHRLQRRIGTFDCVTFVARRR